MYEIDSKSSFLVKKLKDQVKKFVGGPVNVFVGCFKKYDFSFKKI